MRHPRAGALAKLIEEANRVRLVSAVEIRWETIDGREVPVWRLEFGDKPRETSEPVKW